MQAERATSPAYPSDEQGRVAPMTNAPDPAPKAETEADARRVREAAALRENLRRRKAQARAREAPPVDAETPKIG